MLILVMVYAKSERAKRGDFAAIHTPEKIISGHKARGRPTGSIVRFPSPIYGIAV